MPATVLHIWACGWYTPDGKEDVAVFDTEGKAKEHARKMRDLGMDKVDVWEV